MIEERAVNFESPTMRKYETCVFWSGGKDCFGAYLFRELHLAKEKTLFVTFVPPIGDFHCHPLPILEAHSRFFEVDHWFVIINEHEWKHSYQQAFLYLRQVCGIRMAITGDLFPRGFNCDNYWLAQLLASCGIELDLPMSAFYWPEDILDFLQRMGVHAILTGLHSKYFNAHLLGSTISLDLLRKTELYNHVDFHLCGENGEYHTCVTQFSSFRFLRTVVVPQCSLRIGDLHVLKWSHIQRHSTRERIYLS